MTHPRTNTTILNILIVAVALQASAITAQAAGSRPPTYRTRVISCAAAGYPAGWGPGCTVYRRVPVAPRAPRAPRLTPR